MTKTTFTCTFMDSTVVTLALEPEDTGNYFSNEYIAKALGEETGHDPDLLSLLDDEGNRRYAFGGKDEHEFALTVIINPAPVTKTYRIVVEAGTSSHSYVVALAVPQGASTNCPAGKIQLKWAMDERADDRIDLNTVLLDNHHNCLPFDAQKNTPHYYLSIRTANVDDINDDVNIGIIYLPETGTWMPHSVMERLEYLPVTKFEVTEVTLPKCQCKVE